MELMICNPVSVKFWNSGEDLRARVTSTGVRLGGEAADNSGSLRTRHPCTVAVRVHKCASSELVSPQVSFPIKRPDHFVLHAQEENVCTPRQSAL